MDPFDRFLDEFVKFYRFKLDGESKRDRRNR